MRIRLGGIVVEVEKRGLFTIILLTLFLVALIFSASKNALGRSLSATHLDDSEADMTPIILKKRAAHQSAVEIAKDENYEEDVEEKQPLDKNYDDDETRNNNKVADADENSKLPVRMMVDSISRTNRRLLKKAADKLRHPNRPPDVHYNINVTLSDLISLDRDIADTRPPVCATFNYDLKLLPKVTVIIPFFNEAPTMLLRNIHSILNRTPDQLVGEIILVDDRSYDEPLLQPLADYVKLLPRVRLLRNSERSGLIVSRMRGARESKTPAIIFVDAHSEVNVGWLEPLLDQLRINPSQILQPFIDGVDNMNLIFSSPPVYYKGAFSWDLRYTWLKLPDHEQARTIATGEPFFTPTIVGCAIAVMKDYFMNLGAFDEGMYVWGGENLEIAFRAWMCGGKATTVTCSRVGHVFKQSPNKFDGTKGSKEQTVQKNLIRVADVWMDDLRKFFYATTLSFDFKRFKLEEKEIETLKERTELRKRLKCKNFEWYVYNVIPEMETPPMDSRYYGEIMNWKSRACWEVTLDYYIGMTYFCFEHKIIPKNNFAFMKNGLLRYRDRCVKIVPPKPYLVLSECPTSQNDIERFGVWDIINKGVVWGGIQVRRKNEDGVMVYWCVVQVTNAMPEHKSDQMPQLGQCDDKDEFQMWSITYPVDFSMVPEYMGHYQQDLT